MLSWAIGDLNTNQKANMNWKKEFFYIQLESIINYLRVKDPSQNGTESGFAKCGVNARKKKHPISLDEMIFLHLI